MIYYINIFSRKVSVLVLVMVVVEEAAEKVVVLLIVTVLVGSNELCSELLAPLHSHFLTQ